MDDDYEQRLPPDESFVEAFIHAQPPWPCRLANSLAEAFGFPPRYSGHVVLGRRLRPFSFWHEFALDAIQSPLQGYNGEIGFAALFNAVEACRCGYLQIPRQTTRFFVYLQRRRLRIARKRYAPFFLRELVRLRTYQRDYRAAPEYGESFVGDPGEPIKTPPYLYLVALLLRYSQSATTQRAKKQIWMMPIGEARWWAAAHAEAHGVSINIMTPEIKEAFRRAGHKFA